MEVPVMGTQFGSDQTSMRFQERDFIGGTHMQDVKSMLMPYRQIDRSTCGDDRRWIIPDPRMVMHRQVRAQASLVGSDSRFIFAMGADRDFGFSENSLEGFLFVDEQIPGARSDEDFNAGDASGDLEGFDIGRRCAHVEAIVDERL